MAGVSGTAVGAAVSATRMVDPVASWLSTWMVVRSDAVVNVSETGTARRSPSCTRGAGRGIQ